MNDTTEMLIERLSGGNLRFVRDGNRQLRVDTAIHGQHPHAIVICCSDSRVIPEKIFSADIGELFVIRVAGNVLDNHQLGSVEYAAAHLGCELIVVLGHTGCGAVGVALSGGGDGFIKFITDEILEAVGTERDPYRACRLNVEHAVGRLKDEFHDHPEIPSIGIVGAIYDIETGSVEWL